LYAVESAAGAAVQQNGRALDQAHEGGIGNPVAGAGDVCPGYANPSQHTIKLMPCMPRVVPNAGGPPSLDYLTPRDDAKGQ